MTPHSPVADAGSPERAAQGGMSGQWRHRGVAHLPQMGRHDRRPRLLKLAGLGFYDELHRLQARGVTAEWADIRRDLAALAQVEVYDGDQRYLLRTPVQGVAGKVLQAAGIAIQPRVGPAPDVVPTATSVSSKALATAVSTPGL